MDLLVIGMLIGVALPGLCRRVDRWLDAGDTADPEALHALRRIYDGGRR